MLCRSWWTVHRWQLRMALICSIWSKRRKQQLPEHRSRNLHKDHLLGKTPNLHSIVASKSQRCHKPWKSNYINYILCSSQKDSHLYKKWSKAHSHPWREMIKWLMPNHLFNKITNHQDIIQTHHRRKTSVADYKDPW